MILALILACASPSVEVEEPVDDPSVWTELSEDDLRADDSGKGDDTGKDDTGGGYPECGEDVKAGAPCDGDWTTTTCIDGKGAYWWCEGGAWTTGK